MLLSQSIKELNACCQGASDIMSSSHGVEFTAGSGNLWHLDAVRYNTRRSSTTSLTHGSGKPFHRTDNTASNVFGLQRAIRRTYRNRARINMHSMEGIFNSHRT